MARIVSYPTSVPARPPRQSALDIGHFFRVWRERRALERLDADALRDIGISTHEAREETRKRIWDAPPNWLR